MLAKNSKQLMLLPLTVFVLVMTLFGPLAGIHTVTPVLAQTQTTGPVTLNLCTFIPQICEAISGSRDSVSGADVVKYAKEKMSTILTVVFIGIVLLSVFIIIRAGITYIQSQGNEAKIEEASKAIKSVFIGIAILFVGIIGIVLVLVFFNLNTATTQECVIDTSGKLVCL